MDSVTILTDALNEWVSHLQWAVLTVMVMVFPMSLMTMAAHGDIVEKYTIVGTSGGGVFLLQPVKALPWQLMGT